MCVYVKNYLTSNIDYLLFRSLFIDDEVLVETNKSSHEPADVVSKGKQATDVGKVGSEEEDKGAAKDEADKKSALVQFVMWSQEDVDLDCMEEGDEKDSESLGLKVEDSKSQKGFLGEETGEKAVEKTEMQFEEEKLCISNVGAKTDIRALFDSDSDSDSDL